MEAKTHLSGWWMQQRTPWTQITPPDFDIKEVKHCRSVSNVEFVLVNDPLPRQQRITANLLHGCFNYRIQTLMPLTPKQLTKKDLKPSLILRRSSRPRKQSCKNRISSDTE